MESFSDTIGSVGYQVEVVSIKSPVATSLAVFLEQFALNRKYLLERKGSQETILVRSLSDRFSLMKFCCYRPTFSKRLNFSAVFLSDNNLESGTPFAYLYFFMDRSFSPFIVILPVQQLTFVLRQDEATLVVASMVSAGFRLHNRQIYFVAEAFDSLFFEALQDTSHLTDSVFHFRPKINFRKESPWIPSVVSYFGHFTRCSPTTFGRSFVVSPAYQSRIIVHSFDHQDFLKLSNLRRFDVVFSSSNVLEVRVSFFVISLANVFEPVHVARDAFLVPSCTSFSLTLVRNSAALIARFPSYLAFYVEGFSRRLSDLQCSLGISAVVHTFESVQNI
jgi:hypothetical protein